MYFLTASLSLYPTRCSIIASLKVMLWSADRKLLTDTVSTLQQPGLQMDERDEAAAPAEQVRFFLWLKLENMPEILWKCSDFANQPSPVVMRRRKEEAPPSLEPPLRDSTAHLRCRLFEPILNLAQTKQNETAVKQNFSSALETWDRRPRFAKPLWSLPRTQEKGWKTDM